MIIVKLHGGLGNQLFQVAFGKAMEKSKKRICLFDTSNFKKNNPPKVLKILPALRARCWGGLAHTFVKKTYGNLICKPLRKITDIKKNDYNSLFRFPFELREKQHNYDRDIFNFKGIQYFNGYWQSQKYFYDIEYSLKKYIWENLEKINIKGNILKYLEKYQPTAIHIRRKDYQKYPHSEVHHLLGMEYYETAIRKIVAETKNKNLLVFSDDPDWAKNRFAQHSISAVFAAEFGLDDEGEFACMSRCSNFIIANSTFSWWAAFLSRNEKKHIYYPNLWFKHSTLKTEDMFPEKWKKIQICVKKVEKVKKPKSRKRPWASLDVIVPCYQAENYVEEAVQSALEQTFEPKNIILIDDGSLDGTFYKLEKIKNKYPKKVILVKHSANRGVSAARNTGILKSKAKFISFLDSDDIWLPENLEEKMLIFKRDQDAKIGAVSSYHYIINDRQASKEVYTNVKSFSQGDLEELILGGNLFSGGSGACVRRSAINNAGLFNVGLVGFEDLDMWVRIAQAYELRVFPNPLFYVRQHCESCSSNQEKMQREYLKFLLINMHKLKNKKKLFKKIKEIFKRQQKEDASLNLIWEEFQDKYPFKNKSLVSAFRRCSLGKTESKKGMEKCVDNP